MVTMEEQFMKIRVKRLMCLVMVLCAGVKGIAFRVETEQKIEGVELL